MSGIRRLFLALAALALFTAACGDDDTEVTEEQVDEALDQIDEELGLAEPEDEPADEPAESEDTTDEEAPPEEPAGPTVTDACLVLRHYSTGLFEAPYEAMILFDLADAEAATAGADHPGNEVEAYVFPGAAPEPPGGSVHWPVYAPGESPFPTVISVDGFEISEQIYDGFLGGNRSFVAAASEERDEEITPRPCGIEYMVMVDPASLSG